MKEVFYRNIEIWSQHPWVHGYEVGDYSDSIFPEYRTKGSGITVKVDIVEGREEALANMPQSVEGVPVRYIFAPRYELLMSGVGIAHRPLVSGLEIVSRKGDENGTTFVGAGTLGGLATLSNGKKVLFTNAHVMAGLGPGRTLINPQGTELMFQGGEEWNHKVGSSLEWMEFTDGVGENSNEVDLAYCVMDDDIDVDDMDPDDLGAVYKLHDSPHSNRSIVKGVKEPVSGLRVICLGMQTGPIWGTIERANEMPDTIGGRSFKNLFTVEFDVQLTGGNSGSSILHELQPGVFQMVGILMARGLPGLFGVIGDRSNFGVCFPASAAQRALGLTFGHDKPRVSAGNDKQANVGDLVTLDGSGSDPDNRGDVTFRWKQVFSPPSLVLSEDPIDLSDETDPSPTFTPVKAGDLEFELTVTDVDGLSASDKVTINVVQPPAPVANAGEDRQEDTGVTVTLDGSTSTPMEGLTYSWVVEEPTHGVTLVDANTAWPHFISPVEDVDVAFTLTVTDGLGRTATASVTLQFRDTWSDWQDVVPIQHQGELVAGAR